jgi:hypothetical protein
MGHVRIRSTARPTVIDLALADSQVSGVSDDRRYCHVCAARPLVPQAPMTPSSVLARLMRPAGSVVGLVVVGAVVLVSALCHLSLPSGSGHDAAHSRALVSISDSDSSHLPALDGETDGDGEHSCQHERSTAAHPQAPALTAIAKPVAFDSVTNPATDVSLPLVADRRDLSGPRQHILCVLRT